ncbi:MAG: methyl-accepting chemotaxis protein [Spongiibacteraceae bacterium]|jgi:methyl-accepting chemotaxis protein|nr:methyl-accepting chemotaxis protein [Spongiibacteraceae bacterium]
MISWFRQLSIAVRIWLLSTVLGIGVISFAVWMGIMVNERLFTEKMNSVDIALDTALNILDSYHQRVQAGDLDVADAQESARQALRTIRYLGDNYLLVIDLDYIMVLNPSAPQFEGRDTSGNQDVTGKRISIEIVDSARARGVGSVDYFWPRPGETEPQYKLANTRLFQPWGWVVASGVYPDDIAAEVRKELLAPAVAAVVALAVLAICSLLMIRSITQPLRQTMTTLTGAVRNGADLTVRLPEEGNDELALMARRFNHLIQEAQQAVAAAAAAGDQLATASNTLGEVTGSARAGLDQQRSEIESVVTAMNEMVATVQEVATHAARTAEATHDAELEAADGQAVVESTARAAAALAEELTATRAVVQRLVEDAGSIGRVLDVINGVAEQTNLLALNAAIEAARAGEHGRGFAVVADEVRTLAQRSQHSTQEIQEIIERLQNGARSAMDQMEASALAAQRPVEESNRASAALAAITRSASTISGMAMQIASAAEQQAATAEEINGSITRIHDAHGVSGETVRQTDVASSELRELAAGLQRQLARLRL